MDETVEEMAQELYEKLQPRFQTRKDTEKEIESGYRFLVEIEDKGYLDEVLNYFKEAEHPEKPDIDLLRRLEEDYGLKLYNVVIPENIFDKRLGGFRGKAFWQIKSISLPLDWKARELVHEYMHCLIDLTDLVNVKEIAEIQYEQLDESEKEILSKRMGISGEDEKESLLDKMGIYGKDKEERIINTLIDILMENFVVINASEYIQETLKLDLNKEDREELKEVKKDIIYSIKNLGKVLSMDTPNKMIEEYLKQMKEELGKE